jgi:hypothetical protein
MFTFWTIRSTKDKTFPLAHSPKNAIKKTSTINPKINMNIPIILIF